MIKLVIALAAASGLAATLLQQLSRKHRARRSHDEGHRHREDVNRWEAEGGNLPPTSSKKAAAPPHGRQEDHRRWLTALRRERKKSRPAGRLLHGRGIRPCP